MGARVLRFSMFFLFYLFLVSDSSTAENPPSNPIWQNKKHEYQQNQIVASVKFTSQPDATTGTIPIINPTTPTTTTPIVNPTIPPPAAVTTPITNPTIPPPTTTTNPTPTPTPTTTTPASSSGSWCIASPTATETALQVALDYACGYGGADCSAIQPGAPCYSPTTLRDHAAYAFNEYYKKNPVPTSCAFGGTAQLTNTDPSSGSCRYTSSRSTPSTSPPFNPTTPVPPTTYGINPNPPTTYGTIPTAPTTYGTIPTAPATYGTTPGAPTTYGSEPTGLGSGPTGTPSSANSISCNLLLLFTTTSLILSLVAANYL